MLTYTQALDQLGQLALRVDEESVATLQAAGRILARPVPAAWALPRFTNSSMDGYAVRHADLAAASPHSPVDLPIAGESAAGHPFAGPMHPATAIRISTGAAVPEGADAVVPIEMVEHIDDNRVRFQSSTPEGQFIRRAGEDVAAGTPLLGRGTILRAPTLAFLAMFNLPELPVLRRPVISIIGTGDEVRPHGQPLGPADVVGVNLYYLENELRACGCEPRIVGIAPDDTVATSEMIAHAIAHSDAVVTIAGVSVGEHDTIGAAMGKLGAEILFWRVAVRPGKPMLAARIAGKPLIGLPGNPVSVCTNTEIFLKPWLRRHFGIQPAEQPTQRMTLLEPCPRDKHRLFFVHAVHSLRDGAPVVLPLAHQSSGNLRNPAESNGLIVLEPADTPVPPGQTVDVIPITTGFGIPTRNLP